MEEHTRLLEALCRICRKKKGEERKEDVAKYAEEIKQIWVVSVLVASPNVHPRFICMKCWVRCSSRDYLAGKIKSSQEAKLWSPLSNNCAICKYQVARGRPPKRKRVEVRKNEGKQVHGSDTDSASERADEQVPPRVYCMSMDKIRDCIAKIPYTDQCAFFQELCSVIPRTQLFFEVVDQRSKIRPTEYPPVDCIVAIDNDQIVQREWKVKVGQKSRVSIVTSVSQLLGFPKN